MNSIYRIIKIKQFLYDIIVQMRGSDVMFNILTSFQLSKKISIDKLGIIFRPLNVKEKQMILNQIDNMYTKNKKIINEVDKKYTKDDELELSMELLKYDDLTRELIMFCFLSKKKGFKFNSPKKINRILDNMVIIETKNDVLCEFIKEDSIIKFISNILSFYDIYSSNIKFNNKVRLDYSYILNDNILNPKEKDYYINLIMTVLMSYENKMMKTTELSEEYLITLKSFISKLNKEEIRRFLNAIDLFYSNNIMIQNRIVNNITLAESILIKEGEDIKANYILKSGLILKQYTAGGETINSFIRVYLNYCYDIRSAIVHGNEEKILSIFNTAIQKNKHIKDLAKGDQATYNNKKQRALGLANMMSMIVNRAILKYWIENPSIVSYLKK